MKKLLSVFLIVIIILSVLLMPSVSASTNRLSVSVLSGEDKAEIVWDTVENAATYLLSISYKAENYTESKLVKTNSYSWQPQFFSSTEAYRVNVTAFDESGAELARSIDLDAIVMEVYYDYWSVYGDTDFDMKITVLDATRIQMYKVKRLELSNASIAVADVNADGEVTIIDATIIQYFCADLVTDLGVDSRIYQNFWYGGIYYDVLNTPLEPEFEL